MLLLQIIRSKKRISLPLLVQRLIELEQQIKSTSVNLTTEPVEAKEALLKKDPLSDSQPKAQIPTEPVQKPVAEPTLKNPLPIKEKAVFLEKPEPIPTKPEPRIPEIIKNEIPQAKAAPQTQTIEKPVTENKPSDKLDTLLHFTAVELDGVVKKE